MSMRKRSNSPGTIQLPGTLFKEYNGAKITIDTDGRFHALVGEDVLLEEANYQAIQHKQHAETWAEYMNAKPRF